MFKRKSRYVSPQSYKKASKAKRNQVCNGCGPKGYDWFVPDNLLGIDITECCNIHDWMYKYGQNTKDKDWADTVFYINMHIAVAVPKNTWHTLRNCRCKLVRFYYEMVKKYGCDAFSKKE